MSNTQNESDVLLRRAANADPEAVEQLLGRHRPRLHRMVTMRLDRRLAPRLDASDIVQEALAEAAANLPLYVADQPLSFYPWLRRITWQRLIKAYKANVVAERRSVNRELDMQGAMSNQSAVLLADKLAAKQSSPSQQVVREEMKTQVRLALDRMLAHDREILILKYMEQLSVREIAEVTGVSEAAVKMRHMRALRRIGTTLRDLDSARSDKHG